MAPKEEDKEVEMEEPEAPDIETYGGKVTSVPAERKITPRETFYFEGPPKGAAFTNVVFFKSGRKWGILVGK